MALPINALHAQIHAFRRSSDDQVNVDNAESPAMRLLKKTGAAKQSLLMSKDSGLGLESDEDLAADQEAVQKPVRISPPMRRLSDEKEGRGRKPTTSPLLRATLTAAATAAAAEAVKSSAPAAPAAPINAGVLQDIKASFTSRRPQSLIRRESTSVQEPSSLTRRRTHMAAQIRSPSASRSGTLRAPHRTAPPPPANMEPCYSMSSLRSSAASTLRQARSHLDEANGGSIYGIPLPPPMPTYAQQQQQKAEQQKTERRFSIVGERTYLDDEESVQSSSRASSTHNMEGAMSSSTSIDSNLSAESVGVYPGQRGGATVLRRVSSRSSGSLTSGPSQIDLEDAVAASQGRLSNNLVHNFLQRKRSRASFPVSIADGIDPNSRVVPSNVTFVPTLPGMSAHETVERPAHLEYDSLISLYLTAKVKVPEYKDEKGRLWHFTIDRCVSSNEFGFVLAGERKKNGKGKAKSVFLKFTHKQSLTYQMQTRFVNPNSTELYLCKYLGAPHLPAYFADIETADYQILIVRDHGSRRRKDMYIALPPFIQKIKNGTIRNHKERVESGKYYEPDWLFFNST